MKEIKYHLGLDVHKESVSIAIAALLDCPNTSLLGVNRMLTDADYRRRIVSKFATRL